MNLLSKTSVLRLFFMVSILVVFGIEISPLRAQVIFLETFDNVGGPTSGGAGTYKFPAGWKLVDVDNRTRNASVSYVNNAWERREDFKFNVADSAAFSTSWYSPEGAADDFFWYVGGCLLW